MKSLCSQRFLACQRRIQRKTAGANLLFSITMKATQVSSLGLDVLPVGKLEAMLAGVTDRQMDRCSAPNSCLIFREPFRHPMCRYTADGWTSNKAVVQWNHSMGPVYQSVPAPSPKPLLTGYFSQVTACGRYSPVVRDSISL